VTIPAGQEIWSDALDFTVAPQGNVSITVAFGSVPSTLTGHPGSRTTSYEQTASTNVSAANMTSAQTVVSWYYISGMEVMADASTRAIVAMGDSLTDGRGTDNDKNNRWTDDLVRRLQASGASNIGMLNMGIGGSVVVGTTGTSAQARFPRDVVQQAGVRYVIVFDGVNDILGGQSYANMTMQYGNMIKSAHDNGMLIYGATITPFGGYSTATTAAESLRQQINTYIKSGAYDGYFDFDAAVTDNGNPPALQTQYATLPASIGTDHLHMNPTGYQQLANAVDLTDFVK
jgi:lysophospholipase L1-like esterase